MESYIKKLGLNSLIVSVLLIIVSLLMVFKPLDTIDIIIIMLGYVIVVDGLIHFASYFRIQDEYRYFSYELAQAIIDIILGFLIVFSNVIFTNYFRCLDCTKWYFKSSNVT